ncbi:MAG: hypothetical protein WAS36_00400 [Candidatus Saccharimonadales bacterium]
MIRKFIQNRKILLRNIINVKKQISEIEDLLANAKTDEDTIKLRKKMNKVKRLLSVTDELADDYKSKMNAVVLVITLSAFLLTIINIYTAWERLIIRGTNIHMNYYMAIVTIIPVIFIAIYFSSSDREYRIENYMESTIEFISRILPSLAGLGACLYALALNKSNGVLFLLTMYGLGVLIFNLVINIVMPRKK